MVTASAQRIMDKYNLPLNTAEDRARIERVKSIEDEIRYLEGLIPRFLSGTVKTRYASVAEIKERINVLVVEHARVTNRPVTKLAIDINGHAQIVGSPLYPVVPAPSINNSAVVNSSSGGIPTGFILLGLGVFLFGR